MKSWWDILDIEQDANLRSVKRAYAAKLKAIRQDEDPTGFMALRAAYDGARAYLNYLEMQAAEHEDAQHSLEDAEDIADASIADNITSNDASNDGSILDGQGQLEEQESNISTPSVVEQLMDEVHALINSPWGAGRVDSWSAILDDERLDDIDVYADFENALLNYMLNIHGFFDEDSHIKSKLDLAIAHLIFERFGWQRKRNSVHFNPVVFDWLADKFFQQNGDAPHRDLDEKNSGANAENYSQFNQRGQKKKPNPKTEKFLELFDGNAGLFLVCAVIVLMGIYQYFSPAANKGWDEIYQETMSKQTDE